MTNDFDGYHSRPYTRHFNTSLSHEGHSFSASQNPSHEHNSFTSTRYFYTNPSVRLVRDSTRELCWSDGFVWKWCAEVTGVWKWGVSISSQDIFSDNKEEADDENVANDIRGDCCYQKFIFLIPLSKTKNNKNI